MTSLIRKVLLATALIGLAGLAGCGGDSPSVYVHHFFPPTLDSFRSGMTTRVQAFLSDKVVEKTYVDMEISSADQQWVTTDPPSYLIYGVGADVADVEVTAKKVPVETSVAIGFRIRNSPGKATQYTIKIQPEAQP